MTAWAGVEALRRDARRRLPPFSPGIPIHPPRTSAGASRGKLSSSSSGKNQNSSHDTHHLSATTTPAFLCPESLPRGHTLSLHGHLQIARRT